MFRKSTITTRLPCGFGLVIALLVVVVAAGLAYLGLLTSQIDLLATRRLPLVAAAGEWEASVLRTGRHMQSVFVLAEAGELRQELIAIGGPARAQALPGGRSLRR